jgi:hypothetical protein
MTIDATSTALIMGPTRHCSHIVASFFVLCVYILLVEGYEYVLSSNFSGPCKESVVLHPDESLVRGQYRSSPGNQYRAGISETGDFVLQDLQLDMQPPLVVWSAGISQGFRCSMQSDGNLVIRDVHNESVWSSRTNKYPGSRLVVDESGQMAIKNGSNRLWLAGIPRDFYNHTASQNLEFPIRGTFYYPWYPETFSVNGKWSHYQPSLGWYSSSDPEVARTHIDALDYAHIGLSIASWWGPDTHLDRARLTMLMDETIAMNSSLKWTVYYEDEMDENPSSLDIYKHLNYLLMWFARHPAWAYKDGKPIIFVYNENSSCEVVARWMAASNGEWYVVLKVFKDFEKCSLQPDSFHQYGSGTNGVVHNQGYSFVISPGFWEAGSSTPRLSRLPGRVYCQNVKDMTRSGEPWQLILSFNEAGEGTMVESSPHWQSKSGYGKYLDCLHSNPSEGNRGWHWKNVFISWVLLVGLVALGIL